MPGQSAPPITTATIPENATSVELPVCPICGLIGRNPGPNSLASSCVGPQGNGHKRTHMQMVRFVADPPPPEPTDIAA